MDASVSVAFIIAVCGFVFTAYNFFSARKKETIEASSQLAEIHTSLLKVNMKLDNVCATTSETRVDIKAMNNQIQTLDKELEVVKRDLKTAFVRIDEIKEELQNG